ncbi:hypothetical protein MMC28_006132 [Mycoblastus sanguinarius]|nr:hypothetical protein [Mycoblastus sanguinarius]
MHELAMNHDSGLESGKPSRNRGKTQPQPIMSTSAAFPSTSITSALGILDIFTTSGVHELRTLPVFQFSQVAHATVSLIKTYFAIFSGSEADQGQSVSTELVDKRFNGLVESLRAAAANDKSPPAQTFLMVVMSLRSWYERKRQATAGFMSGEGNDTQGPTSSPQSRKTQRSGEDSDRALHLLSEVAMGKSNNSNYSHKDGLNVQKSAQDALGLADSGEALKDDALSKVMRMLNNMDWGRISSTLQSS